MKDYYTLKEIILGLRNEQLKIAKELKELETKLSIYGDKKYENSRFDFNILNNDVYFVHYLHKKYSFIENILNLLTFKFKEIVKGDEYFSGVHKLGNDNYTISGVNGLIASVKEHEQESFNEIVNDILNNQLVSNGATEVIKDNKWRYANNVLITPLITTYSGFNSKKCNSLFYFAKGDFIDITKTPNNSSYKDTINELLNIRYDRKYFPEYIQNIIDTNDDIKKDIIVSSDISENKFRGKSTKFYLNDEREAFVLVKK